MNMKIYDDVLDKQFLGYINYTLKGLKWMPHVATGYQKTPQFFNSPTLDQHTLRPEYVFLFDTIVSIIKKELEIGGKDIAIKKGYVNLYPFGIGGDWHIDSESSNQRTILVYPSDWKEEYGGASEFQSGEKVEYKKNRLLIFDGTKLHRSAVHQNPKNRYTIAFKAYLVDPEEEQSNENQ